MCGKNSDTTNKSEFAPEVVTVPPVDISTERQASQTEEVSEFLGVTSFHQFKGKRKTSPQDTHPATRGLPDWPNKNLEGDENIRKIFGFQTATMGCFSKSRDQDCPGSNVKASSSQFEVSAKVQVGQSLTITVSPSVFGRFLKRFILICFLPSKRVVLRIIRTMNSVPCSPSAKVFLFPPLNTALNKASCIKLVSSTVSFFTLNICW